MMYGVINEYHACTIINKLLVLCYTMHQLFMLAE